MTVVHRWGKMNFRVLRPCFTEHLFFHFWLSSEVTPKSFQFSNSLSTAALTAKIFMAWDKRKIVKQTVMLQWIISFSCNTVCMMSRLWFSHSQSCRFTRFQNTRKSCLKFWGCRTPTFSFIFLQGRAGATGVSKLLWAFLMVFLIPCRRVAEIYPSQLSCVITWCF